MRTILLMFALIALAAPAYAASIEQTCREMVGKEVREGEGGNSHVGQLQVQRFSECMMSTPRYRPQ